MLKSRLLNESVAIQAFHQAPEPPITVAPTEPPRTAQTLPTVEPPTVAPSEPTAPTEPTAPSEPTAPEPPKTFTEKDIVWRDKEISAKHRQNQTLKTEREQAKAEADRLRRENEELRALAEAATARQQQPGSEPRPSSSQPTGRTYTEEDVRAEAARQLKQQRFEDDAASAYAKGKDTYGDKWEPAMQRLRELGGFDVDMLEAVLATDNPAQVSYELGANPEEFQRIRELPATRRMVEFVKLAMPKTSGVPRVSNAPAPVAPLGGRGGTEPEVGTEADRAVAGGDDLEAMQKAFATPPKIKSDAAWHAQRRKEKLNSTGRVWSPPSR